MFFKNIKILVGTTNVRLYKELKKELSTYNVQYCWNINEILTKSMNDNISLMILDSHLNMNIGKVSVVKFLKDIHTTKKIPVILMTANNHSISFHSADSINEPYGMDKLQEHINYIFENTRFFVSYNEEVQNFVDSLLFALESKDEYSKNHSRRVALYAANIAKKMGESNDFVSNINIAGMFHDLGKIGIPDSVLLKPGKLTDDEYKTIQKHPTMSAEICKPIIAFQPIISIILGHHERFDGRGYPNHLKGDDIPFESRIIAVADSFDALTSNRAYRKAFDMDKVLNILHDGRGTQWDAEIIDFFLDSFDETEIANLLSHNTVNNFNHKENLILGTIFDNPTRNVSVVK